MDYWECVNWYEEKQHLRKLEYLSLKHKYTMERLEKEKERIAQEKEWEIPAFLRKVKFNK